MRFVKWVTRTILTPLLRFEDVLRCRVQYEDKHNDSNVQPLEGSDQ